MYSRAKSKDFSASRQHDKLLSVLKKMKSGDDNSDNDSPFRREPKYPSTKIKSR